MCALFDHSDEISSTYWFKFVVIRHVSNSIRILSKKNVQTWNFSFARIFFDDKIAMRKNWGSEVRSDLLVFHLAAHFSSPSFFVKKKPNNFSQSRMADYVPRCRENCFETSKALLKRLCIWRIFEMMKMNFVPFRPPVPIVVPRLSHEGCELTIRSLVCFRVE